MAFICLLCLSLPVHVAAGARPDIPKCKAEFESVKHSVSRDADAARYVIGADLDGDGDVDFVSASSADNKVAWYENVDGAGAFGAQQVVSAVADGAYSVAAADLDGDGDLDLASACSVGNKIVWYENNGTGSFGAEQVVSASAGGPRSVFAADIDGDGSVDLVSALSVADKIVWHENTDGAGSFGPEQVVATGVDNPQCVVAADLDADGDLDVAVAAQNEIVWFENEDGDGSFGLLRVVSMDVSNAQSVVAADVDGDGDLDLASASGNDNKIAWYENLDGRGAFGEQQVVTRSAAFAESVLAVDLDNDGDVDLASASANDDKIAWYENTDGAGTFGPQQVVSTGADGAQCVAGADVNGDGMVDLVSASINDDEIAWYETTDQGGESFGSQRVVGVDADAARSVAAFDLDNDGDLDLVSASFDDDTIAWYENTDGAGTFGLQRVISTFANGAEFVTGADIDNDGDVDVISASYTDDKVAWYENKDGTGTFGPQQVVTSGADGAKSVVAADLDGDGNVDIASASFNDAKLAWYRNNGVGQFGVEQVISSSAVGATSVAVADIDGDGDVDMVVGAQITGEIVWHANEDGTGSFGPGQVVTSSADGLRSVVAADLDGDGDVDLASASFNDNTIAWYSNNGSGTYGPRVIVSTGVPSAQSVAAGDVDGDGDVDLVSASDGDDTIAWYENVDGAGTFGPGQVVSTGANNPWQVIVADIDGDGDVDVASASINDDKIAWYPRFSRGPFHRYRGRVVEYGSEGGNRTVSFAGVAASLAALSRCTEDTLVLSSGVYGCARNAPFEINFRARLEAGGDDVVFECGGGVLFRAVARDGNVGDLEVVGVDIRDTGVALTSPVGAPGLRADGMGARIALINTTMRNGVSVSSPLVLGGGIGGCILALNGGRVDGLGAIVERCSASGAGGGVAVIGEDSVVSLRASVVGWNSAMGSGGGLAVFGGGTLEIEDSVVVGNTAVETGGGLWVDSLGHSVVNKTRIVGNVASVGGGAAVSGEGIAESVAAAASAAFVRGSEDDSGGASSPVALSLVDVRVENNVAGKWGGGLFGCDGRASISGVGTSVRGNVAERSLSFGSSGDVFVCAAGGEFVPNREVSGAGGVPWFDVEPSIWSGEGVEWAVNGPLASLVWVDRPTGGVEAGGVVQGTIRGVDWFGQDVVYSGVVVKMIVEEEEEEEDPVVAPVSFPLIFLSSLDVGIPGGALGVVNVTRVPALVRLSLAPDDGGAGGVSAIRLETEVEVGVCGVGRGGVVEGGVTVCAPCSEDTFSESISFEPCGAIRDCLPNTVVVVNGSAPDCECLPGFTFSGYNKEDGRLVECVACPRGGVCARGLREPVPAPGFFAVGNATFVACKRPKACPGRVDRSCSRGYEGYMCNRCVEGWYSNSKSECVECPGAAVGVLVGALLGIVVVGVVASVLIGIGVVRVQSGGGGDLRMRTVPASPSMILVCLQVVGLLADAQFGWGEEAQATLGVANVANVDVNLFASECSLSTFHAKYVVSVVLPLVVLGVVFVGLVMLKVIARMGVGWLSGLKERRVKTLFDAVLFGVAPLLYIPMARATFVLFDCSRLPNGDLVLDVDPGVACLDEDWWAVVWVGVVGLVTYVGGIPVYFLWCLVKRRHKLMLPGTFARYGGLYKLYRVPYYWGGVAELGKRLGVVVAAVFVSDHQLVLIGVLLAIFLSSSYLVSRWRPYFFPMYNQLDFRLTSVLVVLLLLGGASYAERNTPGSSAETPIFVGVVVVLFVLAGICVHAVVAEVLQIMRARSGKYSAQVDRQVRIASFLEKECDDLDGSGGDAVRACVERLGGDGGGGRGMRRGGRVRANTIGFADMDEVGIEMEAV